MNQFADAESLNAARGAIIGALAGDAAGATLEFIRLKPTTAEVEAAMRIVGGGGWKSALGRSQVTANSLWPLPMRWSED